VSAAAGAVREPAARRDPRAVQCAPAFSARVRAVDPLAAATPPGVALQRCACGGGCPMCRAKAAGLPIHPADDAYEREADRVADAVMRGGSAPTRTTAPALPAISRLQRCSCGGSHAGGGMCPECAKMQEEMQRSASGAAGAGVAPPVVHDVLRSSGEPLDAGVRAYFEPRFGRGFGDVRVHTDGRAAESARAVDAVAYTVGSNLVFGAGAYRPDSAQGRRLIAHELTHVVQQGGGGPGAVQRTCASVRTIDVFGVNLPGSSRSLFDDEAQANKVLEQCCMKVRIAGGKSWVTTLMDRDAPTGVLNEYASPGNPTPEEVEMLAHRPGDSVLHAYYVPKLSSNSRGESFWPAAFPTVSPAVVVSNTAAVDTFVHELVHVLSNDGGHHADPDNLMAEGKVRNVGVDKLEPAQCNRM